MGLLASMGNTEGHEGVGIEGGIITPTYPRSTNHNVNLSIMHRGTERERGIERER